MKKLKKMSPSAAIGIIYVIGLVLTSGISSINSPSIDSWVKSVFENYFVAFSILGLVVGGLAIAITEFAH
jgi:hypothetical protein